MSDEYTYLQSKAWRAITYNWDTLSRYGATSRAYCLTDFQVAWLLSITEYMSWSTRWENCPCTDDDLNAMKAELDYRLMSCIDLQPYQIQSLYDQQMTEQLDYLQSLWDDDPTPSAVNPSTPDDYYSGDDSQARLDALCTACKVYIYSYAQNFAVVAQQSLGIAIVVGLASKIPIVGGVIASILYNGLAYATAQALEAMQDESALNDIVCCMNSSLNGQAITQGNFEVSLDGCSFDVGSNAEIARDIIASDLDQFKNWLTFINSLGNSYKLALIGVKDCPCESSWEHTFDFELDSWDFDTYSPANNPSFPMGQYVASTGWQALGSQWNTSPSTYRRAVAIEKSWTPNTTITEISMIYDITKGTYTAGNTIVTMATRIGTTNQSAYSRVSTEITNGTDKTAVLTSEVVANSIVFHVSASSNTSASYSGGGLIKSVTVKGTGFNPFA